MELIPYLCIMNKPQLKGSFMRLDQVNDWLNNKGHNTVDINGSFIRVEVLKRFIDAGVFRQLQCDVTTIIR